VKAKLALAAAESRPALGDGAVLPAMQGALEAAAPIYRKYVWAAHDRANQRTISEARALLKQYGAPIAARLAASYDTTWPAQAIRIDFVYNAGPPGNAYTTNDPTHITIAQDPRHSGLALLEIMFHEASHGWDGLLMKEVDEAARERPGRRTTRCTSTKRSCSRGWGRGARRWRNTGLRSSPARSGGARRSRESFAT
jgi:hypothetical protein